MSFSSRTEQLRPGRYLVALTGDLDLYTAPACRDTLLELIDADAREVVIDLSGVRRVDATTTGVFVIAELALQRRGGRLLLVCDDDTSLERFDAAGLTRVFELELAAESHDARVAAGGRAAEAGA